MIHLMPQPWFRATATSRIVHEFLRHASRPLVEGERALGSFILPPFQRHPVWTQQQQISLLESIWSGLPIGCCVFNQTKSEGPTDEWLLDGQQRVTAIIAYTNDKFPVYGYKFSELPINEKRCFHTTPISVYITDITNASECRLVYDRLAYGGTAHDTCNARVEAVMTM